MTSRRREQREKNDGVRKNLGGVTNVKVAAVE